jgi:hypothetical protein
MRKNSGTIDRIIRVFIAVLVFVLVLAGVLKGLAAIIPGIIAGILLFTGVLGQCPIYQLFGLHTLRTKISHDS